MEDIPKIDQQTSTPLTTCQESDHKQEPPECTERYEIRNHRILEWWNKTQAWIIDHLPRRKPCKCQVVAHNTNRIVIRIKDSALELVWLKQELGTRLYQNSETMQSSGVRVQSIYNEIYQANKNSPPKQCTTTQCQSPPSFADHMLAGTSIWPGGPCENTDCPLPRPPHIYILHNEHSDRNRY